MIARQLASKLFCAEVSCALGVSRFAQIRSTAEATLTCVGSLATVEDSRGLLELMFFPVAPSEITTLTAVPAGTGVWGARFWLMIRLYGTVALMLWVTFPSVR